MDATGRSTAINGSCNGSPPMGNEFKYKYCRLCGVELTCGVFIYGEEGRGLQLADKIRKTLSVLVLEEDALPKKICADCCDILEQYAKFKDTVSDTQVKLKAIAQSANNAQSPHKQPRSDAQQPVGLLAVGRNSRSPNQIAGSTSTLMRCTICGAEFSSKTALDGHINAEHGSPVVNSPNQEEEVIELHIPSPTPSEEPRLVEENGRPPPSVNSVPISRDGPDAAIASTSSRRMPQTQSNISPNSSVSTTSGAGNAASKRAKKNKAAYHCTECNKTLASQAGYYNHIMVVHKRRRFSCTLCENTYCSKASLQHHHQSSHAATSTVQSPTASSSTPEEISQFKCSECPKTFRTKKCWSEHKKTHTRVRPFECTVCHKFFKTRKCLWNHMSCHSTKKSFSCPTCDKQFTKSKYLEEHKNLHAPDRKLGCPFCPLSFNGFPNYMKHVRRKHAEKIGPDGKTPKALRVNIKVTIPETTGISKTNSELKQKRVDGRQPCSSHQVPSSSSNQAANTPTSFAPTISTISSNGATHSENQGNVWSDFSKTSGIGHSQLIRSNSNQNLQYSMSITQQPQPHQHQSIPVVPMDAMVDSVIHNALMSHPQPVQSTSQSHSGHNHGQTSSVQAYNGQHNLRSANNNHTIVSTSGGTNHGSTSFQIVQANEINKSDYVRQFDAPLELCVRNSGDDSTAENEADKNNYNQLVDLTSAKIVDLSGVGLVMAAAASASNNVQSSTTTTTNSMMYRQQQPQQQMPTMSMVQMSMIPMDLTDQQGGMESSGHMHMPLSLTSNQSTNHNSSTMMNNLVDLSFTGTSNRTNNHFQMQQHQDEQTMTTSTFLRELLDLSCSTSTTRSITSTSTSLDTYSQSQIQQTHFQPQQAYQQSHTQYQQSPQHQSNQIQQYELNLSSKSGGYGMGSYQGQSLSPSHSQSQSRTPVYHLSQQHQHGQPLGLSNGHGHSGRNNPASSSSSSNSNNATTNQFHNVMYNDTLFM